MDTQITINSGAPKVHMKEQPQTTYFFERWDGSVFATNGRDAWAVYSGRIKAASGVNKLIGTSDGRIYHDAVTESHEIYKKTGDFAMARAVLKKGFDDELAAAKSKIIPPPNYDKIDKYGNPTKLM
jgi:hypothetical protein